MARPRNLNTKGPFNVFQVSDNLWELRFKNSVPVFMSSNRSWLYRCRLKYRTWYSIITELQYRYSDNIKEGV